MAKNARPNNRFRLWVWGKVFDFHVVTSTGSRGNLQEGQNLTQTNQNGTAKDFAGTIANPSRYQKNQIVLHCTAANHSAEQTVDGWNSTSLSNGASAHFVVERSSVNQANRPPIVAGADLQDIGLVDAVRIFPEDTQTYHAGLVNQSSIGIEIANVAFGWHYTNRANEPHLKPNRCNPGSSCPNRLWNSSNHQWLCNCMWPYDDNRYIVLPSAYFGYRNYQAFEDKQYTTLIFLLRYLCISHRIPRKFLGNDWSEVSSCFAKSGNTAAGRKGKSSTLRYRGILYHRNVTNGKPCPGVPHRNRLFRGIIDEWWLPCSIDGIERPYYSGPFEKPVYNLAVGNQPIPNPPPTTPMLFRFRTRNGNQLVVDAHTMRQANIESIIDAQSYFDLDEVELYYKLCETRNGGMFPVGKNKIWHGGIHLFPPVAHPFVYAAASGTIVAARLSSNPETDAQPGFGSQRFVLVRHYIHWKTQNDARGRGNQIDYSTNPSVVFSLYMHLGDVAQQGRTDNTNPPWFNKWRRENPNLDIGLDNTTGKGRVFCPNLEVSVGDILGVAGMYDGKECIHFEVFTNKNLKLTVAPWNDEKLTIDTKDDPDGDAKCDSAKLDRFLVDVAKDGLDVIDLMRAASSMRNVKTLNKSEWALRSVNDIASLFNAKGQADKLWTHVKRFTFWDDLMAQARQSGNNALTSGGVSLADQLGADGIVWHYHPITFMQFINNLIHKENRVIDESKYASTNVSVNENFFITEFVARRNNNWVATPAGAQTRIQPIDFAHRISNAADFRYHFFQAQIACRQCVAHNIYPATTFFSMALLSLLEDIRMQYGGEQQNITISSSYLCPNHSGTQGACTIGTPQSLHKHVSGIAVDFHPAQRTPSACQSLFNAVSDIVNRNFNQESRARGGTISQDALPDKVQGAVFTVTPPSANQALLSSPQRPLTQQEATAFQIHLEFVDTQQQLPANNTTPLITNLHVKLLKLKIIDDSDWFGAGDWIINAKVNSKTFGPLKIKVNTGDVIDLPLNWEYDFKPDPSKKDSVNIQMSGIEEDTLWDDSLGSVTATYNENSSPKWGIGIQSLKNPDSKFELLVEINSLNSIVHNI